MVKMSISQDIAGYIPYLRRFGRVLVGSREGVKYGDWTMRDSLAFDGLFCAIDNLGMGEATERYNPDYGLHREQQDEFSTMSHQRAAAALEAGVFADEIVAVPIPQRKGDPLAFATDEGVRASTTVESLAALRSEEHTSELQSH